MTVSTDGQICYGIAIEDGSDLPWSDYDGLDDWWIYEVCGFRHSFKIYNESGNYIDGIKPDDETINRYWHEKEEFEISAPKPPVEVATHCSYDYPMYFVAIPGTYRWAHRGYPLMFDPSELTVTDEQREALLAFCADYGIDIGDGPHWWLSSLWG